jgi:hypothetical protein
MNLTHFFNERRYSPICDEFPDETKYPLFYTVKKYEFTIEPGDALFIPMGWFHLVYSDEGNPNTAMSVFVPCPETAQEGQFNGSFPRKIKNPNSNFNIKLLEYSAEKYDCVKSTSGVFQSDYIAPCRRHSGMEWYDTSIKEFLQRKDPTEYVLHNSSDPFFLKFLPDPSLTPKHVSILVNWGNVRTTIHYDLNDNYLCQFQGKKRVILFEPEDRDKMYTWNPYPLELIKEMNNSLCIQKYVEVSSKLADSSIEPSAVFEECIQEYCKKYKLDIPRRDYTYITCNTNEINKYKPQNDLLMVFLFMEAGQININEYNYEMKAGQVIIFPISFTFRCGFPDGQSCMVVFQGQRKE